MPNKSLEEVLKEQASGLMAISGVVGTAQGLYNGQPCIRGFIVERAEELLSQIPVEIEGYRVEVQDTGEFHKSDPD